MDEPKDPKEPSAKNRRVFPRRVPKRRARICCYKGSLDLGANLAVAILDISESGIRLLIKSSLDAGQEVNLTLEGTGHKKPLKSTGRIMWSVPAQDGNFCVGIKLDKYLPYQEIVKLI